MNTDQKQATSGFRGLHAGVTDVVLRVFYEVYNELGGGFLESVYHEAMALALRQEGLTVDSQVAVNVLFRRVVVGQFRADLVVNDLVLLELKAVSAFDRAHEAQILHYLRATHFEVGLLLNFGPRPVFRRYLLDNATKGIRVNPCLSVVGSAEGDGR